MLDDNQLFGPLPALETPMLRLLQPLDGWIDGNSQRASLWRLLVPCMVHDTGSPVPCCFGGGFSPENQQEV